MYEFGAHWTNGWISWVPIPKVASSAIRAATPTFAKKGLPCQTPSFAVVRDPYERYWSGVRQHERDRKVTLSREEVTIYDEHTLHQFVFLLPFHDLTVIPLPMIATLDQLYGIKVETSNVAPVAANPYDRDEVESFYAKDVQLYQEAMEIDR